MWWCVKKGQKLELMQTIALYQLLSTYELENRFGLNKSYCQGQYKCLSSSKNIVQYLNLILFKYDLRRAIWRALSHYQKISSSNYTLLKRDQCQWMTLKVSGTHVDWCFCWSTSHPGTLTLKNLVNTRRVTSVGKNRPLFPIGNWFFSLLLRKDKVY